MEVPDQPVLAWETVRYQGEPVAMSPLPTTRRPPGGRWRRSGWITKSSARSRTPKRRCARDAPKLHLSGNVLRRVHVRHGDPDATADVVVSGEYEIGMQDQAFLGPESGLAVPDGRGGVDLYISTQWLHIDRDQVAESLGLEPGKRPDATLRRRRGVRRARRPLHAGPRLHARPGDRPTRKDGLRPRRVFLRPRPPPPRENALRTRRNPRREARLCKSAAGFRRRRVRLQFKSRVSERGDLRLRSL